MASLWKEWEHDELVGDLLGYLTGPDRMLWADMQMGSAGSPRPDVYRIEKSYVRPNPASYECKVSHSDFRADVTSGKYRSYYSFSWSVTFAFPAGVASPKEVPEMCGALVRYEHGWRWARRATIQPHPIDQQTLLKLLIDGVEREGPQLRAQAWKNPERAFAKRFGAEAARYVADAASVRQRAELAEQIVADAHRRARAIEEQAYSERQLGKRQERAADLWRRLCAALKLDPDSGTYIVEDRLRRLESLDGAYAHALRLLVGQMSAAVNHAASTLESLDEDRKTNSETEAGAAI